MLVVYFARKLGDGLSADVTQAAAALPCSVEIAKRAAGIAARNIPAATVQNASTQVLPQRLMQDGHVRYEGGRLLGKGGCGIVGEYRDISRHASPQGGRQAGTWRCGGTERRPVGAGSPGHGRPTAQSASHLYDHRSLADADQPSREFLAIVMDYAPNGCLHSHLTKERLRDVQVLVWMYRDLALILLQRNAPGDRDEAAELLRVRPTAPPNGWAFQKPVRSARS